MEEYEGTVFYSFADFAEWMEYHMDSPHFQVVCRFSDEAEIDALFSACWIIEDVCLIIEEANLFFDPRSKVDSFRRLVSQGRHKRISLICVTQRVPELPITFRAQRNSIVTFAQREPYDLGKLEEYGFDPDEVSALEKSTGQPDVKEGKHYLTIGDNIHEYEENF